MERHRTPELLKDNAGYLEGKGLRGRKVYPHHRGLPANHWDEPTADRTRRRTAATFRNTVAPG